MSYNDELNNRYTTYLDIFLHLPILYFLNIMKISLVVQIYVGSNAWCSVAKIYLHVHGKVCGTPNSNDVSTYKLF